MGIATNLQKEFSKLKDALILLGVFFICVGFC